MPIDIQGWIEYSPYDNPDEREEEQAWLSWMEIGAIVTFNDEVNWVIFGNPRKFRIEHPKYTPIAKNRGFPKNPGPHLKLDMNLIREHELKYEQGEFFGFTHFFYSEIDRINWLDKYHIQIKESNWGKLFELVDKFKELKSIESQQIRFVVWYNW